MCSMARALWKKRIDLRFGRHPNQTSGIQQALLSAVAHGSNEATALVTAAAISLCPLLSTEGSLRLSAGARPSVGRLVPTEAC